MALQKTHKNQPITAPKKNGGQSANTKIVHLIKFGR